MAEKNYILEEIQLMSEVVVSDTQKQWFAALLEVATPVEVVPVSEVFNPVEIALTRRIVKPQIKECYKNAHILTLLFPSKVRYVEGKVYSGLLPIEHAFNKVGDKYVDITFEMVLKEDVTKCQYVKFGEYDAGTIEEVTEKTGYYGSIYNHIYLKKVVSKYRKKNQ